MTRSRSLKHTTKTKKPSKRVRLSAQSQIAYEALLESGICWLGGNKYSVTLALGDIDYSLAPEERQSEIIERYSRFINGHTTDHHVQIQVINEAINKEELARCVQFPLKGDGRDSLRREYNDLIAARLSTGRNNTRSSTYVTITVEAKTLEEAKTSLARIAAEDEALLREVGNCTARRLTGVERVDLLARLLRPGSTHTPFSYVSMLASSHTTKDYVAPWLFDLTDKSMVRCFSGEDVYWRGMILRDLPNYLSDRLLASLADLPITLTIAVHIDPIDKVESIKLVKREIAKMDMQRIDEIRKLVRKGLGEDFLGYELEASRKEAEELRDTLEKTNEKLFRTTIVLGVAGETKEALAENVARVKRACAKESCTPETAQFMQMDCLNALLPLGRCDLPFYRTLITGNLAMLMPFTTQELTQVPGVFYGVNARSKNLIVADRTRGMNSNGFILGTSGSGKSQFAKFEITQLFLTRPHDEIIIIDPEHEYTALCQELDGQRIVVSAGSSQTINALDLPKDYQVSDSNPVLDKAGFVLDMLGVLIGGADGLSPEKRSIIDRVVMRLYDAYWETPRSACPTLIDVYEALKGEPEREATEMATALEMYARGSLAGFSRATNVDVTNRFVVFDTADLGREFQTFGMMVVLEAVWNKIALNRARGVRTWLYIDEFHLLFANDYAAAHCQAIFKRVRKWGAAATGITQNIEELLLSDRARLMLANSDSLFLFNQQATDADELTELFKFSEQQRSSFTYTKPGCGLLKVGGAVIPFDNKMNPDSDIFRLFSTSFTQEVHHA